MGLVASDEATRAMFQLRRPACLVALVMGGRFDDLKTFFDEARVID